jgi:hypothetical protein
MDVDEKGRFCAVCSKVVRDFTGMDTQAAADIIAAAPVGSICGRFRQSQVTPPSRSWLSPKNLPMSLRRFLIVLVICFGPGVMGLHAESASQLRQEYIAQAQDSNAITGSVVDHRTGRLLRDIEVRLMRGKQVVAVAVVDANGEFQLELPGDTGKRRSYSLVLAYKGRDLAQYRVNGAANALLLAFDHASHYSIPFVGDEQDGPIMLMGMPLHYIRTFTITHSLFDQNTMIDRMLLGR